MLNIGMTELFMFGIIALLVLGPEKLPEGARFAGKWYGKIKRMISSVQNDLDRELRISELREQMQQEIIRIQELEKKMQMQMGALENQRIDLSINTDSIPQKIHPPPTVYMYIQQPEQSFACRLNHPKIKAQSILNKMPSSIIKHELNLLKVAV